MSEVKVLQERYEGTLVQVNNSRGIRLSAGFFNAHTKFAGKVQVTVVTDRAVLLSAGACASSASSKHPSLSSTAS